MTEEKDPPTRKKNPQAGKCPKCYVSYLSTENGYYCPQCGDMGWVTFDDSQIVAKSVKQIKKEIKMTKIDLDEIEASLGYLEDWKKIIAELRAAREIVAECREIYDDHGDLCNLRDRRDMYYDESHFKCNCGYEQAQKLLKELEGGDK